MESISNSIKLNYKFVMDWSLDGLVDKNSWDEMRWEDGQDNWRFGILIKGLNWNNHVSNVLLWELIFIFNLGKLM